MYSILRFSFCLLALGGYLLRAQDQVVVVSDPPKVCSAAGNADKAILSQSDAPALIHAVLDRDADANTYYMIHDVTYVKGQFVIDQQHWYVYYKGWDNKTLWGSLSDPAIGKHFQENRIFGSQKVGIIYIHNNVPTLAADLAIQQARVARAAQLEAGRATLIAFTPGPGHTSVTAEDRVNTVKAEIAKIVGQLKLVAPTDREIAENALEKLKDESQDQLTDRYIKARSELEAQQLIRTQVIGGDTAAAATLSLTVGKTKRAVVRLNDDAVVDSTYGDLATLAYKIAITKRVPMPLQNLQTILSIVPMSGPAPLGIDLTTNSICGGKEFDVTALPSDMSVSALTGGADKQKELSKNNYLNERKYWYDFSIALPLKSYNDLTVNSTDNTLTAKKITKQNVFAMVNISPFGPYDTYKARSQVLPVILVGIPIAGQPLNHPMAAAAVGLNKVQFFVGTAFNHNTTLSGATAPAGTQTSTTTGATPVHTKWGTKLVYGINFPVSAVKDVLKPKK